MSKKRMGSSIDDFLKEEGIFEEAQAQAVKEVVAWQLAEAMRKKNLQSAHGQATQDQPYTDRSPSRSEKRHHAIKPATSRQ